MGRKRKKIIESVAINGVADKGMAVGRAQDGQVIFVKGAIPGDIVDVLVLRKKKSFAHGIIHAIRHLSSERVDPKCPHFGICGGCKWQNLDYSSQIKYKHQTIIDAMTRIGNIDSSIILPTIACEQQFYYRNKLEYSFSDSRWLTKEEVDSGLPIEQSPALGFHPPGSFDKVVDIHTCMLQDQTSDKIRNHIRNYALAHKLKFYNSRKHEGFLRNMIFRNNRKGEWMVIISFGHDDKGEREKLLENLKHTFPEIKSLHYVINEKLNDSLYDQEIILYAGIPYLSECLGDIQYQIGPKSFFQTNTAQAEVLYDKAVEFCQLKGHEIVYDLYTGIGSIALYIAKACQKVVGIEEVESAIKDARLNMISNKISNAKFYTGDVKDILTPSFSQEHGTPDLVITDPPRAGMHAEVISVLLQLEAPRIVYVSCNPATQARDLSLLAEKYDVEAIQGVDMFPHTHHIENIASCRLRNT